MWQTKYALAMPRIWEWEWIFGRVVKAISSLGVHIPCINLIIIPGIRTGNSLSKCGFGVIFHSSMWNQHQFLIWFLGCNCNSKGSNGTKCDNETGHCSCLLNISGNKCDQCVKGFYGFPNCQGRFLSTIFLK